MSLLPEKNPILQTSTRRKLYFTNPTSRDSNPAPLWESVVTIIPEDPGLCQQHVFSTKIKGHLEIHLENYFRPKPFRIKISPLRGSLRIYSNGRIELNSQKSRCSPPACSRGTDCVGIAHRSCWGSNTQDRFKKMYANCPDFFTPYSLSLWKARL